MEEQQELKEAEKKGEKMDDALLSSGFMVPTYCNVAGSSLARDTLFSVMSLKCLKKCLKQGMKQEIAQRMTERRKVEDRMKEVISKNKTNNKSVEERRKENKEGRKEGGKQMTESDRKQTDEGKR